MRVVTPSAALVVLLFSGLLACRAVFEEAALPAPEDSDAWAGRIAESGQLGFNAIVDLERLDDAGLLARRPTALPFAASAYTAAVDSLAEEFFVAADREVPAAAGAVRELRPGALYDGGARRILVPRAVPGAGAYERRRQAVHLADAFALALLDQNYRVTRRLERMQTEPDRAEAFATLATGAAYVIGLEATLAPVRGRDATSAGLLRLHRRIAEALLDDPDGAPEELLATEELPDVARIFLDEALALRGAERRRAVLRRFLGARFVLEAKDRLGGSNLARVFEDPPRSTEQILHPETYFDHDDPPSTIAAATRAGLLGPGFAIESSSSAGELGLRSAFARLLGPRPARALADAWNADAFTLYRDRESGNAGLAWHIEFEQRLEGAEAVTLLRRALERRLGGTFLDEPGGALVLADGVAPAALVRRTSSVGLVIGGRAPSPRLAAEALLDEEWKPAPKVRRGGPQDFAFDVSRAIASPILYDVPGRLDTRVYGLEGLLFVHRAYPGGAEHRALNLDEFPGLGRLLPEEAGGLLFRAETGPSRGGFSALAGALSWDRTDAFESGRFWTPLVDRTRTAAYDEFGVLGGLAYRQGAGAGRTILAPLPAFSKTTGLDGDESSLGVFFDAVELRRRAERDARLRLLPFGLAFDWTSHPAGGGFDLELVAGLVGLSARTVVPETRRRQFGLGFDLLLDAVSDSASGERRFDLGAGVLFRAYRRPDESRFGLLSIGGLAGRSLLGFGRDGDHRFVDLFFLRF